VFLAAWRKVREDRTYQRMKKAHVDGVRAARRRRT
jgi:hypothetical protein